MTRDERLVHFSFPSVPCAAPCKVTRTRPGHDPFAADRVLATPEDTPEHAARILIRAVSHFTTTLSLISTSTPSSPRMSMSRARRFCPHSTSHAPDSLSSLNTWLQPACSAFLWRVWSLSRPCHGRCNIFFQDDVSFLENVQKAPMWIPMPHCDTVVCRKPFTLMERRHVRALHAWLLPNPRVLNLLPFL
jgi:hypothetical protein